MTGPVVETVTLARLREGERDGGPGMWVQAKVPEPAACFEVRSASLHPVDEEGRQALLKALIRRIEDGDGTTSEAAARSVLDLLGFSAPVVRAEGGEQ